MASQRFFVGQTIIVALASVVIMAVGATVANAAGASALSFTTASYNADLIYEANSATSSATSFDNVGNTWFQNGSYGLPTAGTGDTQYSGGEGLTTGTAFNSAATDAVTGGHSSFTIQSAGSGAGLSNNALFLSNTTGTGQGDGNSSGTMTLAASGSYTSLSIMAASTSNSGTGAGLATGTVTLHFSSGASATTSYNAYDWQATSVSAASSQVLSSDVYRASSSGTYATTDVSSGGLPIDTGQKQTFNMYETDINLAYLTATDGTAAYKDTLTSITFNVATNSSTTGKLNTTGIFGISAGNGAVMPEPGTDCLVLFGLLGTVALPLCRRVLAKRASVPGNLNAG